MYNPYIELEFEVFLATGMQQNVTESMDYLFALEADVSTINIYLLTPYGGPRDVLQDLAKDIADSGGVVSIHKDYTGNGGREFDLLQIPCKASLPLAAYHFQRMFDQIRCCDENEVDGVLVGPKKFHFFKDAPIVWDPELLAHILNSGRKFSISKWLDSDSWYTDHESPVPDCPSLEQLICDLKLADWSKTLHFNSH